MDVEVKKGKEVVVDYSEYAQEGTHKLYVDYPYLGELPKGIHMRFEQSDIVVQVLSTEEDFAHCKVIKGGALMQYDRVVFDDHVLDTPFFTEKDKKDILRGLEHGVHMIAASGTKDK